MQISGSQKCINRHLKARTYTTLNSPLVRAQPLILHKLAFPSMDIHHTVFCASIQLMPKHKLVELGMYVHARKCQFVHQSRLCACTEDYWMYVHTRKHHFVHCQYQYQYFLV